MPNICRLALIIITLNASPCISLQSQSVTDAVDSLTTRDRHPAPVGGPRAIQKNVYYPEILKRAGIEGTVIVEASIDDRGNVRSAMIARGAHPAMDSSAVKAVRMTAFTPGLKGGRPVSTVVQIPVRFHRGPADRGQKHTLYPGNYDIVGGGIEVNENARWRAFHAPIDGKGVRLVLDEPLDSERSFWSVMSTLTPEEALSLSKELAAAASEARKVPRR